MVSCSRFRTTGRLTPAENWNAEIHANRFDPLATVYAPRIGKARNERVLSYHEALSMARAEKIHAGKTANRCGAGALAISNANSGAANTANGKEVR